MARGWNDFWLAWIAVDLVGVPLLVHSGFYPSAVLYAVYGGLVLYGFFVWLRASRARGAGPRAERGGGMSALSSVEEALDALRAGRPVLVTDDEDRENEGDVDPRRRDRDRRVDGVDDPAHLGRTSARRCRTPWPTGSRCRSW